MCRLCFFISAMVVVLLFARVDGGGITKTSHKNGFLFISRTGGMVGGQSAESTSLYISSTGIVQTSQERTNGDLVGLSQGRTDTGELFGWVSGHCQDLMTAPRPQPADPGMTMEYYGPKTEVCISCGGRSTNCVEYNDMPPIISDLVQQSQIWARVGRRSAQSGVWARLRPLKPADTRFITVDYRFNSKILSRYPEIAAMFDDPLRLVRISNPEMADPQLSKLFTPGRFSYVERNGSLYILFVYIK